MVAIRNETREQYNFMLKRIFDPRSPSSFFAMTLIVAITEIAVVYTYGWGFLAFFTIVLWIVAGISLTLFLRIDRRMAATNAKLSPIVLLALAKHGGRDVDTQTLHEAVMDSIRSFGQLYGLLDVLEQRGMIDRRRLYPESERSRTFVVTLTAAGIAEVERERAQSQGE